jgi:hypothetical protein
MFLEFRDRINEILFNFLKNVGSDSLNRNIIFKRCDDRLIRIGDRGNIFENVKLNLIYTLRDLNADTEILFSIIPFFLYSFSFNRVFIGYFNAL